MDQGEGDFADVRITVLGMSALFAACMLAECAQQFGISLFTHEWLL